METAFEVRDLRQKEKYVTDDTFLNGYARFLGIYAVGVYNSLCRHANKMQRCWPSIETICVELDIGRNSVIEAVKRLEFFQIIGKTRIGKKVNNRYDLYDKTNWKPLTEVCLKDYSVVCLINFTSLQDKLHQFVRQTSNSKETHSKVSAISENRAAPQKESVPLRVVRDPETLTVAELKKLQLAETPPAFDPKPCYHLFADPFPRNWFDNRSQRASAKNLVEERGLEKVSKAFAFWKEHKNEEFCPDCSTPWAMDTKWLKLQAYRDKLK